MWLLTLSITRFVQPEHGASKGPLRHRRGGPFALLAPSPPGGGAAGPLLPENGMLDSGTCHAPLRLIAHPHLERGGYHLDRFDACLDGELITTSRQPLLDGARALLARGFDPDVMLTIRLASSACWRR